MRYFLLVIIFATLGLQCDDDLEIACDVPCETEHFLSAEAKNLLSNYQGVDTVVFENSPGEEIYFTIGFGLPLDQCNVSEYEREISCNEDTNMKKTHIVTMENCQVTLTSPGLPYSIAMLVQPVLSTKKCEQVAEQLTARTPDGMSLLNLSITLNHYFNISDQSEFFIQSEILDSMEINGSTFHDVIVSTNILPEALEIVSYYNAQFGLVGIFDNDTRETYSYLRVE
jgi:hypothetical protein